MKFHQRFSSEIVYKRKNRIMKSKDRHHYENKKAKAPSEEFTGICKTHQHLEEKRIITDE